MKTIKISLNTIDKVKTLVNELTKYDSDFDLVSEHVVVDAKSLMGIFTLKLDKPVQLCIHSDEDAEAVEKAISSFILD